jgi:hypothetical protein
MVEFAVKKSDIKTGYTIPKDSPLSFNMEIINYDNFEKEVFLYLDYENMPTPEVGYMDVGMGAVNFDSCSGLFLCETIIPRRYQISNLLIRASI